MSENKNYLPELRVQYDLTEEDGFSKTADVPRNKKVAGTWVPDPSKPKKTIAKVYNKTYVVFHFPDAYNRNGEYPVYNGVPFVVWRVTAGTFEDGEFTPQVDASFIDNSTDRWVTDRIKRLIRENVPEGDEIKSHVFVLGKKPGRSAAATWMVEYEGALGAPAPTANDAAEAGPASMSSSAMISNGFSLNDVEQKIVARVNENLQSKGLTLRQFARQQGQYVDEVIVTLLTSGIAKDEGGNEIKLGDARAQEIAANAEAAGFNL